MTFQASRDSSDRLIGRHSQRLGALVADFAEDPAFAVSEPRPIQRKGIAGPIGVVAVAWR